MGKSKQALLYFQTAHLRTVNNVLMQYLVVERERKQRLLSFYTKKSLQFPILTSLVFVASASLQSF